MAATGAEARQGASRQQSIQAWSRRLLRPQSESPAAAPRHNAPIVGVAEFEERIRPLLARRRPLYPAFAIHRFLLRRFRVVPLRLVEFESEGPRRTDRY